MNPAFYDRALRRILRLTALAGVAGALIILALAGARPAAGFLAGAALSFVNLQALYLFTSALGRSPAARRGATVALVALRYALIAGAVYAIVKILRITPAAVLWGLLAALAAVILEILYELILHARA